MTELTAQRLREVLDYDPETGHFTYRIQLGKGRIGKLAGTFQRYFKIQIDRRQYMAHRLAWLHVYGRWPVGQIDHINGNPRDNRIANLRDVSMAENMQNRRAIGKASGLPMGVTSNGIGGFNANIRIGTYPTVSEARAAYLHAKRLFHSGFIDR